MSGSALTVPPPRDDDHDDVAWALRAASAQWRREAVQDAIGWIRRAAETAVEVGAVDRAVELNKLAEHLSGGPTRAVAPPPPVGAVAPPPPVGAVAPPPPIGARSAPAVEVEVDFEMDDDEVVMLDEAEEVEDVDDVEDIDDVEDVDDGIIFDEPVFAGGTLSAPPPAPSSAPPPPHSSAPPPPSSVRPPPAVAVREPSSPARRSTTSRGIDLPPSMRPSPSGLEIEEEELSEEEALEYGELQFEDEAETSRVSLTSSPPPPDPGPVSLSHTGDMAVDFSTAAEYATSGGRTHTEDEHAQLERELGVDLSLRVPGGTAKERPLAPAPPQFPYVPEPSGPVPMAALSFEQNLPHPSAGRGSPYDARDGYDEDMPGSISPVPGRASVRPSRPPGATDRITSAHSEPYGLAPSAELPPAAPAPPIEPPSRPTTAPPPAMMQEPEERPSRLPPVFDDSPSPPQSQLSGRSVPPPLSIGSRPPAEALSSAPELDEFENMFAAISRPPPKPEPQAGAPSVRFNVPEAPSPGMAPAPPLSSEQEDTIRVDGIDLMEVPGLQDLPDDAARSLARGALIKTLEIREEVSSFGVLLVTAGSVQLMPSVADAACAFARRGEVLFTQGTFEDGIAVRVIGAEPGTRVAVFGKDALSQATADCPWVADELALVADKYLAFAGGVLGPLGDSLDDMFRFMVLEKCTVKAKAPGAIIAEAGKPMDGMYVLGGGSLEVLASDGAVASELNLGDFVFPETLLSAGPATATVRAGAKGALVLYATRMGAHELLATCPPFIEILAG